MSGPSDKLVKEIFEEAIDLPSDQWERFLDRRCGSDARLRAKVNELLRHDVATKVPFLEGAPAGPPDQEKSTHYQVVQHVIAGKLDDSSLSPFRAHLTECRACQSLVSYWKAQIREGHQGVPGSAKPAIETASRASNGGSQSPSSNETERKPPPPNTVHDMTPRIEGYRITGVLGEGGMGKVYRAVEIELDRVVALKCLSPNIAAAGPDVLERFRKEAHATAHLHHTNIIPIHHFGVSGGTYYYTMELIEGQGLNKLIDQMAAHPVFIASAPRFQAIIAGKAHAAELSEPLTPGTSGTTSTLRNKFYFQYVARWMADAADALHYAHGKGIIHRDIKPSNLMLSHEGRIMLADFGIAKRDDDRGLTQVGSIVGTYRYMSPQQAMAKRVPLDHRSDIYSLGVTMYELLCLKPAFPQEEPQQILAAVTTSDFVPPRKVQPAVPQDLENICLKAMELRPANRYGTAKEMADDLRHYLGGEPTIAKPYGPFRRVTKFIVRRKSLVITLTSLVLLAAAGVALVGARQSIRDKHIANSLEAAKSAAEGGRWEEADAAMAAALQADPDRPNSLRMQVFVALRKFQKNPAFATPDALQAAERACRLSLEQEPEDEHALNYLGILLKKQGRYAEAIEVTRQLLRIKPSDFKAHTNLGSYCALTDDWKAAQEHLTKAAALADEVRDTGKSSAENMCEPWRALAAIALAQGDVKVVEYAAKALGMRSTDVPAMLLRARAYDELPELRNLDEFYRKANAADGLAAAGDPRARRLWALALLRNGEHERALRAANEALQLNDVPAFAHLLAAMAHAKLGDTTAAKGALEKADQHWPAAFASGDFWTTHDEGVLWIESKKFWEDLRGEVAAP